MTPRYVVELDKFGEREQVARVVDADALVVSSPDAKHWLDEVFVVIDNDDQSVMIDVVLAKEHRTHIFTVTGDGFNYRQRRSWSSQ